MKYYEEMQNFFQKLNIDINNTHVEMKYYEEMQKFFQKLNIDINNTRVEEVFSAKDCPNFTATLSIGIRRTTISSAKDCPNFTATLSSDVTKKLKRKK